MHVLALLEWFLFGGAALLAIAFAVAMVLQKDPVKSVLSLVMTFFGLAVLSVLLAAPFIALLQVIVYAGAILVLFLFVIMLLNLQHEKTEEDPRPIQRWLGLGSALATGGLLLGVTTASGVSIVTPVSGTRQLPVADEIPLLGRLLFSDYLLAFEAVSLLLLLATVGALLLSKRTVD